MLPSPGCPKAKHLHPRTTSCVMRLPFFVTSPSSHRRRKGVCSRMRGCLHKGPQVCDAGLVVVTLLWVRTGAHRILFLSLHQVHRAQGMRSSVFLVYIEESPQECYSGLEAKREGTGYLITLFTLLQFRDYVTDDRMTGCKHRGL